MAERGCRYFVLARVTEFAGVGAGEQKMKFSFLHQSMNLIQKVGKTLNFVDDDPSPLRGRRWREAADEGRFSVDKK